jgi:hypothetical protein
MLKFGTYIKKLTEKGFFPESEAKVFEEQFFNFWPKQQDKRWFWIAFQALEKAGLTYYETMDEEMLVRERLVLIAIIYCEYSYQACFYGNQNFNCWPENLEDQISKDLTEETDELFPGIFNALNNYFGNSSEVADELWLNCTEGQINRLFPHNKIAIEPSYNNRYKQDAEYWYMGGDFSIKKMECVDL